MALVPTSQTPKDSRGLASYTSCVRCLAGSRRRQKKKPGVVVWGRERWWESAENEEGRMVSEGGEVEVEVRLN